MALGSNTYSNSGPLLFLSPRIKDPQGNKVPPHFTVDRKGDDGKYNRDAEIVYDVSGDLYKVEIKEREYNGEVSKEAVFYLRDRTAHEAYRVPIRFGVAGRGLINSFASLTEGGDFTNLKIGYYENRNGYDTFSLRQNDEPVKWKYSLDEQPKPEDIMHKGKLVKRDYESLNSFFEKEVAAIATVLAGPGVANDTKVHKTAAPATKPETAVAPQKPTQTASTKTKPAAAKTATKTKATASTADTTPQSNAAVPVAAGVPAGNGADLPEPPF